MDKRTAEGAGGKGPTQKGSRNGNRSAGKRVTMTDVARLAGCSQSTVSVVLNNTPGIRISRETRQRVIRRRRARSVTRSFPDMRRSPTGRGRSR